MKDRLLVVVVVLVALGVAGCRSTRQVPVEPTGTAVADAAQLYKRLGKNDGSWTDVTVPVKLQLSSPASLSVSGRARMVRGRSVDISLRVLGMEVAQLYVTNDSVYALYRLKKQYIAEGIRQAVGKFPVNLDNLQDLLLGRVFVLGHQSLADVPMKALDISREGDGWNVIPKDAPSDMSYGFRLSEAALLERFVAYALDNSLVTTVGYSGYVSTPSGLAAREVAVEVVKGRRTITAGIEWRWDDAKWDTGVKSEWSRPRGYTRLESKDLLKMVSGF